MALLWFEDSRVETVESSYTNMRDSEVVALRRVNAELREKVEKLEEELWNTRIAQQQSVQRAPESAKSLPTRASASV